MILNSLKLQASNLIQKAYKKKVLTLFLLSCAVYTSFLAYAGLKMGSDSPLYIQMANEIARGDFSTLRIWPLHWMYSAVLSLGVLLVPEHFFAVVKVFHVVFGSLVPVLFYQISRLVTGRDLASFVTAGAMIFYPYLLFWSRYVLTDAFFLAILLAHVWALLRLLERDGMGTRLAFILSSVVLLFSRPSSLPVLFISIGYLAFRRRGKKGFVIYCVIIAILFGVMLGVPSSRAKILSFGTVYQSLWVSTRISTTNADDLIVGYQFELPPGMTEQEYKIGVFREFVTNHPLEYIRMAFQRFLAYWYPWIWGKWSIPHKIVDACISVFITLVAVFSLRDRLHKHSLYFLLLAAGFSALSVFGHVDSDGRYRLPGEISLLLLVPGVLYRIYDSELFRRAISRFGGRQLHGS